MASDRFFDMFRVPQHRFNFIINTLKPDCMDKMPIKGFHCVECIKNMIFYLICNLSLEMSYAFFSVVGMIILAKVFNAFSVDLFDLGLTAVVFFMGTVFLLAWWVR